MPAAKPFSNAALAWLFFFSGALALIYEALWQRRFALVFGSAAPATAAVLAAYFAGLAIGSWTIGNRVSRVQSPLKLYAILECGIALGAILVEAWLHLFDKIHPSINSAPLLLVLKTILAFIALALSTFCMGGTFPALGAFIDRGQHHLGRTAGLLYVVNTAGAAIGVLAVPLALLPTLGARNTLLVCLAGNLLVAALAYRLGRATLSERAVSRPESVARPSLAQLKQTSTNQSSLFLSFLSGLTAFIVQVLWNRAFAQVHENSLYSFALIVAIFIAALAVGGQITRLLLRRSFQPDRILAAAWLVAGAILIASPFIFLAVTNNLTYITSPNGWWHYAAKLVQLALLVVFPVATLIGIALPALFERAGGASENPGKVLGQLLTANLIGSTVGALVAGFVLPQIFGLWGSMIFSGAILAYSSARSFPKFKLAFLFAIPMVVSLGRVDFTRVRLAADGSEKLIAISEGTHGIVAVTERGNSRRLKLNNAYVLGGTASTGDERMQSHIPLLLHPNPQRVAYMGLGTGISAGGAVFHPVQQITLLELVPEVVRAAQTHFADANMRVIDQPQSRLIIEDARNYLRHTREKFDVIIGDLVVPWRAGEGALFTRENFQAGKSALKPAGIFCQWLPMFQLSEDEFRILLNTFLSVFPEAYLWRADFSPNETALALLGFADDATINAETIRRRVQQMTPDPSNPQLIDDYAVWMNFIGTIKRTDVNPNWRINSEDRPWVELLGPLAHAGKGNLFVGRALQNWSRELNAVSMSRFNAGEREAAAIQAGDTLFEFTLSLLENNQPAASRAQSELKQLLPPNLYAALFPQ